MEISQKESEISIFMLEYQQYEKKNGAETDEKNRNYRSHGA